MNPSGGVLQAPNTEPNCLGSAGPTGARASTMHARCSCCRRSHAATANPGTTRWHIGCPCPKGRPALAPVVAVGCHVQDIANRLGRHTRRHGPGDRLTRVKIQHDSQIQPAGAGGDVRDVGRICHVWRRRIELPIQITGRCLLSMRWATT